MAREADRDPEPPEGGAAGERWRAPLTLATGGLAFVSAGGAWTLEQLKGQPDALEQFGLPVIAALGIGVVCFHRRRQGRSLQVALLVSAVAVLLERIHTTLHEDLPGLEPFVNAYEVIGWFPLVYLFSFALLPARHALSLCLGVIALGAGVIWNAMLNRPELAARMDVLEVCLANLGCVAFILALSSMKEHWAAAEAQAVTLRRLAGTDYLTGLPNRREATLRLEREIQRSERYGSPLAVLLTDLDDFKGVNDRFGHEVGDRALQRVSGLFLETLRSTDVCGRWGGEEFLIALPGVELGGGVEAAERLRRALTGTGAEGPSLTASFGVTGFVRGDSVESLVRRADAALYEAKRRGRDRVEQMAPPPEGPVEVGAARAV
jgi:diguanylate cyclase (GGDEF)-like protein